MRADDTIFALSSGTLPAGLAVVRLSGPRAISVAEQLAGALGKERHAYLRTFETPDGIVIDRGLVISFPGPHSFTGEDCVEIHLHGNRAVVGALSDCLQLAGLRPADAGEFSRRALENGKIDLVEAEGLADLLSAETEMQRRLALEHSQGGLSARYQQWADRLTHARALIEAELDFADEDDIPGSISDQVWGQMADLEREIEEQLGAARSGEIIRDGYYVVLTGKPNVGKSSLLNALAQRDVAIVTEHAGTTRDVLHVDLDLDGFLVRIFDTAGIRETQDAVEKEGIKRAQAVMQRADLVLLLTDGSEDLNDVTPPEGVPVWRVATKADRRQDIAEDRLTISTKTGEGLDRLKLAIASEVQANWDAIAALNPGRMRHAALLKSASFFLRQALEGSELDLRAESLRLAAEELGRITGRVDVEDLLGVIFSEFCVGK